MNRVAIQNVTLETVDQCVFDWFDLTVNAQVSNQNGNRKKVNVSFSSGERWITAREKKGVRDKNGVIILPLISIRRTGIEAQATMSSFGVETPNINVATRISPKTNLIQNANVNRDASQVSTTPVVYEITTIPYPDFSVTLYEVQIQTQFILQMNSVIEKIFHELDIQKSFVMPMDRTRVHPPIGVPFEQRKPFAGGYLVGFLDASLSSGDNFEEFTDQERIIRYTCTLRVATPLTLDPDGEKPSIQVERTAFQVRMGNEGVRLVDSPEDMDAIFKSKDPMATYNLLKKRSGLK